jgi:predicted dehydrogenase
MLNIGIIGCGRIAQLRHLPEYAENPHCMVMALYDTVAERAMEMASLYGGKAYDSIEAILADPCIDAVSICVANTFHASVAIAALDAGKHVLCEKPMATTLEDCEHMVAAAQKSGRLLMIGHNQRFADSSRVARELIAKGEIGDILSFQSNFGHGGPEQWTGQSNPWFFDRNQAIFGAIADLGIHKIDLIHFLTGQTTSEVTAIVETLHKTFPDGSPITVDDNAICILRLSGGAIGTVRSSWTFYGKEDNSTRIYGTEGVLRIDDDPKHALILEKKTGECIRYEINKILTNEEQLAGKRLNSGIIDAFAEAMRSGTKTVSDGSDAIHAMKAVFGALRSSERRETVVL